MKKIGFRLSFLVALILLGTCQVDRLLITPDAAPDAIPPDADWEGVLANYEDDIRQFQVERNLPPEWIPWMLNRRERNAASYVRARTNRTVRIEVSYDRVIPYDPPWTDEDEHMAALRRMAELQYPGWEFHFSFDDPEADRFVVLGHTGPYSHAGGNTVRLIWEGIFAHEIAHTFGIGHHYDGPAHEPPGEGSCIMYRNSVSWGPTEQFLFLLDERGDDDAILEAIRDINDRYPPGYPDD